jgi:hypothetical protein
MTLTPDNPKEIAGCRELVQRLSRAASLLDRVLAGAPADRARRVDYERRQEETEQAARRELRELKQELERVRLD